MSFADRRFHMLGIGGAGVSALALVAYAWGSEVTGCDRTASPYLERLERFGIPVSVGHDPAHLEPGMEVVVSAALPADEPELAAARDLGLRRLHRAELLAEMVLSRRSICVAGAHGKTTTSAMIAFVAIELGLDPTFLIGGDVPQLGGNAGPGRRHDAGGRGGRIGRQPGAAAAAHGGRHQRRARPPHAVRDRWRT